MLRTKLCPPLARRYPVPGRLSGRLRPAPGELVLVHASAGYGKTTALAATQEPDWLWYNLDRSDSRPATLALRIAAALDLEAVEVAPCAPGEAVAAELAPRLAGTPLTITFDRWERLGEAREVGRFMSELLLLVPCFGLRLATRVRPDLPLERLALDGRLIDIGPSDLRYDRAQIAAVLGASWRRPTGDELEFADSVLQGWPAALALSLVDREYGEDLTTLTRPGTPVHNYLEGELLHRTLTAETIDLLWAEAVWLIGPGPLLERARTDGQRRLADVLVRHRVGVVRGSQGWELHPLVRRFLQGRRQGPLPISPTTPVPAVGPSPTQPALRIRTFGGLAVTLDGTEVDQSTWPAGARRLLELLLCQPGHQASAPQAARQLWPRHLSGSAVNSFNVALHGLRRVLEPDLTVAARSRFVVHEGRSYRLRIDAVDCDVDEFERLVSQASDPLDDPGASHLAAATALYSDDFLPESSEPFVTERRARLGRLAVEALEQLADWRVEVGRPQDALAAYNQLLELAPAREDIWARLLELHLEAGDERRALAVLQRCEASLQAAGTTEPSGLLRELSRRVRRVDGYGD